jgi:5'-nucleotidase
MRFSAASGAIALSAFAISQGRAEDVLYSRHLAKRDLNADGNYNIS